MTTKDSVVTSVTIANNENKADKGDDSVKEKETVISTAQESAAPAVTHTEEDKAAAEQTKSEDKLQDKEVVEKATEPVENASTQPEETETVNSLQPTTEAASAEVSMEMDDLVVHTVEDDFKIEEQSRDHVSKKSGELPSSTTEEPVSIRFVVSCYDNWSPNIG